MSGREIMEHVDKEGIRHEVYEGRRGEGYFVRCDGFGPIYRDWPKGYVTCLRCAALRPRGP